MQILILLYAGFSLLLAGLSVPMIQKRVKSNGIYGYCIPLTMNNPEIWYPVNRRSGWWLLILAIVLLGATLLLPLVSGITIDQYAIAISVVAMAGLIMTFLAGWKYAQQLARDLPR